MSAMHEAIQDQAAGHVRGIMKFVKPCKREELDRQMEKVNAKLDEGWENAKEFSETEALWKRMAVRQKNKKR
jgi:hypothetical protein